MAVLAAIGLIFGSVLIAVPAQAASPGDMPSPLGSQATCIYQGYSSGTHTSTSQYGLDLVNSSCSSTAAAGMSVYSPVAGTVSYWQSAYGNLCINIAGNRSITLTHINASITSGSVSAGTYVGTIGSAGTLNNNGVAHLHYEIWASPNCYNSSVIPFDSANGARICGAPDLIASPSGTFSNGKWSGTVFTGDFCGVAGYSLRQFYVSGSAWTAADISLATGVYVVGTPSFDNGGIWAREANGHLRQFYFSSGSWNAADITLATGVSVAGEPFAIGGGAFARDTSNHLRQFYVSGGSWVAFDISAATGVSILGVPSFDSGAIWASDTSNHLRQFYVSGGAWTVADLTLATGVSIAGNPVPIPGGVWVRDTSNHLREFYVSSGSWIAFDLSAATSINIQGDPVVTTGSIFPWAIG